MSENSPARRAFLALKSMRLAAVSIAWLAGACVLATLVPQGLAAEDYAVRYSGVVARLIELTGLGHFFRSWSFFLPALVFLANLSTCAVDRFLRELRKRGPRRHGPDLLHLGLVLLAVGSIVSVATRQTGALRLSRGDAVQLPGGRVMRLVALSQESYPDGRPRDWTTTVSVERGGQVEIASFPVRVNHPLRSGGVSLYQSSFGEESRLVLSPKEGPSTRLYPGDSASVDGLSVAFLAEDDGSGQAVLRLGDGPGARIVRAAPGDALGDIKVSGLERVQVSGLRAVRDPAWPLVLAALAVSGAGLFLTFLGKARKDNP